MLEDVALRPGAFDYLKLPIAIQEGRVGKLKIQVILLVFACLRIIQPHSENNDTSNSDRVASGLGNIWAA